MRYKYGEYDGQPFPTPDRLYPSAEVTRVILQFGQRALDAMDQLEDGEGGEIVDQLLAAGLLERDPETGRLRMTPQMVRGLRHRALLQIFERLGQGYGGGHRASLGRSRHAEREPGVRAWEFGDRLDDVDLLATLRETLARQVEAGEPVSPLRLAGDDLMVHESQPQTKTATCVLIDMSGSMMRAGRFYQAKRVALGLTELIRQRYRGDTLDFVGFHSLAHVLSETDLPLAMPMPITTREPQINVAAPLAAAEAGEVDLPPHFTNLQLGLRKARQLLRRRSADHKQLFIITDGQPTGHVEFDRSPAQLRLIYPPTERTEMLTLREAARCRQEGLRFATFALIEDYWGMGWVDFVDRLTRMTRGSAFYLSGDDLAEAIFESYTSGRRQRRR